MGLTTTGFERPLQDDLAADIAADEHDTISVQLDTSESTFIGNLNNIFADRLALAYEALEEAYNAVDPDNARDDRLVALALLTGTVRRDAQPGSVTLTVNRAALRIWLALSILRQYLPYCVHRLPDHQSYQRKTLRRQDNSKP